MIASTIWPKPPFNVLNSGGGVVFGAPCFAAAARSASTPRVRLPYLFDNSTKRGNTLFTLSALGSPP